MHDAAPADSDKAGDEQQSKAKLQQPAEAGLPKHDRQCGKPRARRVVGRKIGRFQQKPGNTRRKGDRQSGKVKQVKAVLGALPYPFWTGAKRRPHDGAAQ